MLRALPMLHSDAGALPRDAAAEPAMADSLEESL
jgi:hypothetical protein